MYGLSVSNAYGRQKSDVIWEENGLTRKRLSYDAWDCIIGKDLRGMEIKSELLTGYIGLIDIKNVSEVLTWNFNGEDIAYCDKGIKWLSFLPQDDWYCITAMMNEQEEILLWYVDMIAGQGIDTDGVPYFDDLYLDLVVYPDGTIIADDMDELEDALANKDIMQEQFDLAIETSHRLQAGVLSDIPALVEYTRKCYDMVTRSPHGDMI